MSYRLNNFWHHCDNVLKLAILSAMVFALVSVGLLALDLRKTAQQFTQTGKDASAAVKQVGTTVADANQRIFEKGGLADIAKKTMLHVDQVSGETAITARAQRKYWDQSGQEVVKLMANANDTVLSVKDTQAQVGRDLHSVAVAIVEDADHIPPLLDQGAATLKSAQRLVDDPDIKRTIGSVAATSANVERTSKSVANIANTVDVKVDKLAHPSNTERTVGWLLTIARGVGSLGWLFK